MVCICFTWENLVVAAFNYLEKLKLKLEVQGNLCIFSALFCIKQFVNKIFYKIAYTT